MARGAAVWRPVVKQAEKACKAASGGGRAVGAEKYGNCPVKEHQEGVPVRKRRGQEKEEKERRSGREEGQSSDHR